MIDFPKRKPVNGPTLQALAQQNVASLGLAAVDNATRPIPNSSDSVVQAFLDMGENIAKAMEVAGDACEAQGQRRKADYYKAAAVAREKARVQAREAGEFIDTFLNIEKNMAEKVPSLAIPTPEIKAEEIGAKYGADSERI